MASGIRDKVAILGMGCSKFGERWDRNAEDLMVEAFEEGAQGRRHRARPDRGGMVRHRDRGAARGQVGHTARDDAAPALHPRHPRRELLRHRHRGVPRRGLRGGLGRGRHRARARRREAQGHRLRRPAAARPRRAEQFLLGQHLGPRLVRPARGGLPRQAPGRRQGPEARHGAHLGQEPRQRRQEPQGAPEEQDHRGRRDERADDRRSARLVRLLRRLGRLGLRDRHHARDRARPGQEGPGRGQGAAARGIQRPGGAVRRLGRLATSPPRGSPPSGPTARPASTIPGSASRCSTCTTASRSPSW